MFEVILAIMTTGRVGNPSWSYQDVLPYFNDLSISNAVPYHGVDGELSVTDLIAPTISQDL